MTRLDDGEAHQFGSLEHECIKLGTLEGCTGTDVRLGSLSSRLSRAISDEGLERTCDMFAMTLRDHPAARVPTTYEVRPGPPPLAMRRTCRTTGRCNLCGRRQCASCRAPQFADAWTSPRGPLHAVVDIEQPVTKHKPLNCSCREPRRRDPCSGAGGSRGFWYTYLTLR